MKLKKFVSLALAGVLAVSMLAGCKANGSSSSEQPVSGVNTAAVIAALGKETTAKVEFTPSASLQTTADKAVMYAQDAVVGKTFGIALLTTIDTGLKTTRLPKVEVKSNDGSSQSGTTDKAVQSYTFVVNTDASLYGATDAVLTKKLASKIEEEFVDQGSTVMKNLAAESGKLTDNGDSYKYTFKYTAGVAVASVANKDGQVTYYAVVTLTRTPSRVAL